MAEKRKDVVFRRVRGRIIPIRVNREQKPSGGEKIAMGAAISGAAGVIGGRKVKKFFLEADKASTFTQFAKERGGPSQVSFIKKAGSHLKKAKRAKFLSKAALGIGALAGGTLIGAGLNELRQDKKGFDADAVNFTGAAIGTGVTALAFQSRPGGGKNIFKLISFAKKRFGK